MHAYVSDFWNWIDWAQLTLLLFVMTCNSFDIAP